MLATKSWFVAAWNHRETSATATGQCRHGAAMGHHLPSAERIVGPPSMVLPGGSVAIVGNWMNQKSPWSKSDGYHDDGDFISYGPWWNVQLINITISAERSGVVLSVMDRHDHFNHLHLLVQAVNKTIFSLVLDNCAYPTGCFIIMIRLDETVIHA